MSLTTKILPPPHPGMTVLDKTVFDITLPVLAARVPAASIGEMRNHKSLKKQLLDLKRLPVILPDSDDPKLRRILLNVSEQAQLDLQTLEFLTSHSEGDKLDFVTHDLTLGWKYWSASDLIDAILPEELREGAPNAFSTAGHLAHMNLKDEYLPYKHVIGEIILDKTNQLRTVVNKLDTIDTEFRFFKMEVLAGEPDFLVTTTEQNCTFTFDFSLVYWNTRLSFEHARLVSLFSPSTLVADVFAGVGPFAVPAAKKGVYVLGNDLNPESAAWMEKNRVKNKVEGKLKVSCEDGREFIRGAAVKAWGMEWPKEEVGKGGPRKKKQKVVDAPSSSSSSSSKPTPPAPSTAATPPSPPSPPPKEISHFVMNLPDSALTFLDAFRGSYTPLAKLISSSGSLGEGGLEDAKEKLAMPMVHVHCFSKAETFEDCEVDVLQRASQALGHPISKSDADCYLHEVRRVAPKKLMLCLSFRLPRDVAFADPPAVAKEAEEGEEEGKMNE